MCVCEWVGWQPWMASLRAVSTIKTIKYEWRHVAEICFAKCRKTLAYQITTGLTNSKHRHAMRPYSHSLPSPLQVELRRLRQESNLFAICTWLTGTIAVLLAHCRCLFLSNTYSLASPFSVYLSLSSSFSQATAVIIKARTQSALISMLHILLSRSTHSHTEVDSCVRLWIHVSSDQLNMILTTSPSRPSIT